MFLRSLRLRNFKCHENLSLDFVSGPGGTIRKTTFLTGENGTGKSAVLEAIALATAGSKALRSLSITPEALIRQGKRSCEIEMSLQRPNGEVLNYVLRMDRKQSTAEWLQDAAQSLKPLDQFLNTSAAHSFVAGYGTNRASGGRLVTLPKGKTDLRAQALSTLLGEQNALPDVVEVATLFFEKGGKPALKILSDLWAPFLAPDYCSKGFSRSGKQLMFDTPEGALPFSLLPESLQNTLAWLTDLVYQLALRSNDFSKPFSDTGLLLIDMPELQWHPSRQRHLHEALTQSLPGFQIVATTQSPFTAQQAGRDELYALRRGTHAQTELVPFIGEPSTMLLHQLVMSPMFGLDTDESLAQERMKQELRSRTAKGKADRAGKAAASKPAAAMSDTVTSPLPSNVRSNSHTEPEDLALLRQIQEALVTAGTAKSSSKKR